MMTNFNEKKMPTIVESPAESPEDSPSPAEPTMRDADDFLFKFMCSRVYTTFFGEDDDHLTPEDFIDTLNEDAALKKTVLDGLDTIRGLGDTITKKLIDFLESTRGLYVRICDKLEGELTHTKEE